VKDSRGARSQSISVTVTFRHLSPSDPLREYAEKKLVPVAELVPGATDAHVVLGAEQHHHRQHVEVTVHGSHHVVLHAKGDGDDMYASIDMATDRLASQARKLRGRVIEEPRRSSTEAKRSGSTPSGV
jgi:putative sigma-54 modulation protein